MPPEPDGENLPRRVHVLPIGAHPPGFAEDVVARASRRLSAPWRLLRPAAFSLPWMETRNQVHADRLLELLEARETPERTILLGLTSHDVGNPIFAYFFGLARHAGRTAFVSTARLSPVFYGLPEDPALTAQRAVIEILHEVGHVAGLPHCQDLRCIMRLTRTVDDLDARGASYCPACAARMPADLAPRPAPLDWRDPEPWASLA